ncbi:MAG: class I SAM-dependent methyltransferase [Rhodospirillaceae bacterium]
MLERRTLFGAAAGLTTAISTALTGRKAAANTSTSVTLPDVEKRGALGRLERLPTLDAEGRDDFLTGFRNWRGSTVQRAAKERFEKVLAASGHDPSEELPMEKIHEIIADDHVVGTEGLMRVYSQRFAHKNFYNAFADDADTYLDEMADYDKIGPGSLELNPGLDIPTYAKHEIHMQPGGYVGNPFAGHLYHYGTNAFYSARATDNYQDQHHARLAEQLPVPEDGKDVKRILDIGCGLGQFAVALAERFPNAEVWGVDVGGPMLRYGHMRAVDQGVAVNFAQRLAEDTKFPEGHFDIVASYIVHHEVPADVSRAIFKEANRILRPGGIYFPIDFYTGGRRGVPGAYSQYQEWKDHRWNNEVWRIEYKDMDFAGDMERAGFDVNKEGSPAWYSNRNIYGTKPA